MPLEPLMDKGKLFIGNDGLMGTLDDGPVCLLIWHHPLASIGGAFVLSLHQIPDVDLVLQNVVDRCDTPHILFLSTAGVMGKAFTTFRRLIDRGRRDMEGVQPLYDG